MRQLGGLFGLHWDWQAVHWVDLWTALGGAAAVAGVVGGAAVTILWGKKANVGIDAKTYDEGAEGVVLAPRPAVTAVGFRKFKFADDGATVTVAEVLLVDGKTKDRRPKKILSDVYGKQYVKGGETLTTTCLVVMPVPDAAAIGWRVSFQAKRKRVARKNTVWEDRVFIPLEKYDSAAWQPKEKTGKPERAAATSTSEPMTASGKKTNASTTLGETTTQTGTTAREAEGEA